MASLSVYSVVTFSRLVPCAGIHINSIALGWLPMTIGKCGIVGYVCGERMLID